MKHLIAIFVLLTTLSFMPSSHAGGEIKEVCKNKMDKAGKPVVDKDGKAKQECKKIKVHKKLEGTEVPDKNKK